MQLLDPKISLVLRFIQNISILRSKHVVIIGRTIIDAFGAQYGSPGSDIRTYFGGAWYVANLISRFCDVTLCTDVFPPGGENEALEFEAHAMFKGMPEIKYRRLNIDQSVMSREDSLPIYFKETGSTPEQA